LVLILSLCYDSSFEPGTFKFMHDRQN
jgi:hypothetical protein